MRSQDVQPIKTEFPNDTFTCCRSTTVLVFASLSDCNVFEKSSGVLFLILVPLSLREKFKSGLGMIWDNIITSHFCTRRTSRHALEEGKLWFFRLESLGLLVLQI